MIVFLGKAIFAHLLASCLLFVEIGTLWVIRIAVKWFWDVDYVEEFKKWLKKKSN